MQLTVRAQRRILANQATGRVLDLGGAASHQSLWNRVPAVTAVETLDDQNHALLRLAQSGARFDTVFSVFAFTTTPALRNLLHHVAKVLAPDGHVLFLEPARLTGTVGTAQRLVARPVRSTTGLRVDRDIPAELRACDLSVISLDRHRTPTMQWWLRSLVQGVAHHAQHATRAKPGEARDPGN